MHLARACNGSPLLARFLDSYNAMPAGASHRLVVALKGYDHKPEQLAEDTSLAMAAGGEVLMLSRDDRFDIGAYQEAWQRIDALRYCFLNSYSRILAPGWLAMLDQALARPGVGVAGATGSWQSPPSSELQKFRLGHGNTHALRALLRLRHFASFPNPHVRTNAFILKRDTLQKIRFPSRWTKLDMWRFECGRNGLTAQIRGHGLTALVVTCSGAFEEARWPQSGGYMSSEQEALLVADNQTDLFQNSHGDERHFLQRQVWGCT